MSEFGQSDFEKYQFYCVKNGQNSQKITKKEIFLPKRRIP